MKFYGKHGIELTTDLYRVMIEIAIASVGGGTMINSWGSTVGKVVGDADTVNLNGSSDLKMNTRISPTKKPYLTTIFLIGWLRSIFTAAAAISTRPAVTKVIVPLY